MAGSESASWKKRVLKECTGCGLCVEKCGFLEKYGHPGAIARSGSGGPMAFECSLCGLCAAVCPVRARPDLMFLEMRRDLVGRGLGDFSEHERLLGYERCGTSPRFSYRAVPKGCKTVLFPGCALSGTRPKRVKELFSHLRKADPSLGIVLDCCTKPSHDLGRADHFNAMFSELRDFLIQSGVETVLTACPSCQAVFRDYGGELSVSSVYEILAREELPKTNPVSGVAAVHDACAARFERSMHGAVREIVRKKGLTLAEMSHQGDKTFCCGEGGAVGHFMPKLAGRWSERRKSAASGNRMISYCAGCTGYLGGSHLLDLVFEPHAALEGRVKVSRAPMTYWNRLRLKHWFKKGVRASIEGARPPLSPVGKVFSVVAPLVDLVASIMSDGGRGGAYRKGKMGKEVLLRRYFPDQTFFPATSRAKCSKDRS